MSVGFNLSLSDLLLIDGFAEIYGKEDKEAIKKVLYNNGMDVSQGFDEVVCTHRNLRGNVVHCMMFQGYERTCKDWLSKGSASWEAQLEACDPQTRIDLKVMGNRGSNTDTIIHHISKGQESLD